MELIKAIDRSFGFPDDRIVEAAYKQGIDTFSDVHICKIGVFAALSDNEEYYDKKASSILKRLTDKHNRTGPFMLMKWLIQIKRGRDVSGNMVGQIEDWARQHPDDLVYSRVTLQLHASHKDRIEVIGLHIKHIELFWRDDLVWSRLGALYELEKKYEMAAFAYEEAIALCPGMASNYRLAAAARLMLGNEEYTEIARKQLCKAVMLDEMDQEAWNLLIEYTTDEKKCAKFRAYRNRVIGATKVD